MVCVTSKGSDQPAHMLSLTRAFASCLNIPTMTVKVLNEHHLELLSIKRGCTCQNATLFEITCHGSNSVDPGLEYHLPLHCFAKVPEMKMAPVHNWFI